MTYIVFIIAVALVFDYINGFHDAANSIATVVGTRVLSPKVAVVWAAFFNFVAAFALETRVAKTIGKGIVDPKIVDPDLILASLVGAIVWNLLTWWWSLPSSSSHALIGGFAGAAFMKAGAGSLVFSGLALTGVFIVLSPLLGLALGFANYVAATWAFRRWRPDRIDRVFRKVQLLSAAAFSFGHGMNDAQKTMGIIFALLLSTGHLGGSHVPFWIVLMCHAAIGLGTLSGGWRIVRTMSMRITPLKPVGGSCAEFAGSRDARRRLPRRNPRVDDPHDHGSHHGRRRDPRALGGEVGGGPVDRRGLGPDDPRLRPRLRPHLEGLRIPPELIRAPGVEATGPTPVHNPPA